MNVLSGQTPGWRAIAVVVMTMGGGGGFTFPSAGNAAPESPIDFDRDIRPVLSDTCFKCHGPDAAKRKADLRLDDREGLFGKIAPGDPAKSELFDRISSTDPDHRMPPPDSGLALSESQIAKVRAWIDGGAAWKQHWSLVTPRRPEVPAVSKPARVRNPIDAFILAKLEAKGLEPSAAADPAVLLRRLSFDLTGLPPRPERVESFRIENDRAEIDYLLGQTAYAERMAFRWLDAARYADTSGYQTDGWRDMWRWRDWVIAAFDKNMPFDQFTIDQLAGDLLPTDPSDESASSDRLIATGFNRNHRGNAEGGIVPEEFQVEYVVDRVDTTFAIWQGLTMGCARCHSHKYDPISQRDYYRVFACFNNIPEYGRALKEGNSMPWIKAPTEEQREKLRKLNRTCEQNRKHYERMAATLPAEIAQWEEGLSDRERRPANDWTITEDQVAHFDLEDGQSFYETDADLGAGFGYFDAFSLGAWIRRDEAKSGTVLSKMTRIDRGSGYNLHVTESGTVQLNLVKRWLDDSLRVETEKAVPPNRWTHVFATYDGTRTSESIRLYLDGKPVSHVANLDGINQSFAMPDEPIRVGAGNADFSGAIDHARIFDRALDPAEVAVLGERATLGEILSKAPKKRTAGESHKLQRYFLELAGPENSRKHWRDFLESRRERDAFSAALPSVMVMREMEAPRQTRVLVRGQYDDPGEGVTPGTPAALPPLPDDAPPNRLGLARWLVSRENPLTARVIVNRVWRDFFGTGLVKTTEDFGVQGERPSHPELLDWLAVEFMESGWDLKHLVRLIATSHTYRQSSKTSPKLRARDPENRLLARGPRFRLPAEMIRDQALAVSGLLTRKIGGPSVKPYQPEGLWKDIASDTHYQQAAGEDLYRRSLYTFWKRTVPPPMMMNFDASSREACEVGLRRTNTPLQALNLMNDVTFVEAARVLAGQGCGEKDGMEEIFRRIMGRSPDPAESQQLRASLTFYRNEFRRDPGGAKALIAMGESPAPDKIDPAELAAWTMICSTLLNLDEVVTKE